jgi:hypothetical protein
VKNRAAKEAAKQAAQAAAVAKIRSGEGPITLHTVSDAFRRCYRTVKRWANDGVLKVAEVRRGTVFVNRGQVIELLDASAQDASDAVDQRTLLERLKRDL